MAILHSPCLCLHLQAPLSTHLRKFILLFFYCFLTHSRFLSVTSTSSLSPSLCAASPPFVNTPLFVDTPPLLTPHPLRQPFIPASYGCVDVPATACEFFVSFFCFAFAYCCLSHSLVPHLHPHLLHLASTPLPRPFPTTSTSQPLCVASDACGHVEAPPVHAASTLPYTRYACTPSSYTLTLPLASGFDCFCLQY